MAKGDRKRDEIARIEGDDDPIYLEKPPEPRVPLDAITQADRNLKIIRARVRGKPWPAIAAEQELSVRRCQQIYALWRDRNPTLRMNDPITIVDDLLHGLQALIEDYQADAEAAAMGTPAAIGAKNGKLRAYRDLAELLQAVGALPTDLGQLGALMDGQIVADRVMTVLRRYGASRDMLAAMLDALGGPVEELSAGDDDDDDGIVDADVVSQ